MKISVKNTQSGNIAKIEVDFEKKYFKAIDIPKDYMLDEVFKYPDFHHFNRWLNNRTGGYRDIDNIIENIRLMHGRSPVDTIEMYIED